MNSMLSSKTKLKVVPNTLMKDHVANLVIKNQNIVIKLLSCLLILSVSDTKKLVITLLKTPIDSIFWGKQRPLILPTNWLARLVEEGYRFLHPHTCVKW